MDDWKLVREACRGKEGAFRKIVENYKKKIFYLAFDLTGSTEDAEDLSQEVFIKAYRFLDSFKGDASLSSWLYRITVNTFIDQHRRRSLKFEQFKHQLDNGRFGKGQEWSLTARDNPESYVEEQQFKQHIQQALNLLSPRERSVFTLRHFQYLSVKKVAGLLNVSEGTVKSLFSRSLKKLQRGLSGYKPRFKKEVEQ